MDKRLRVILVIALTAILAMGLATTSCGDSVNPNGDEPNGNEPDDFNSDEPDNGQPENGEPENYEPEPDWTGLGSIIDCDEFTGQELQIGDLAPDFRFQDAIGQTFSLSDFRGKTVMLNFWTTWCTFCKIEFPYIQQVYDEWQGGEVIILTINLGESSGTVTACIEAEGIFLPVLLDKGREVTEQYGVSGIPRTFFIDKDGLIQVTKLGAFSDVEEIEEILNDLI